MIKKERKPEKMAGHAKARANIPPPLGGIEGGHHFILGFCLLFLPRQIRSIHEVL